MPCVQKVHEAMNGVDCRWELILVDDGSNDRSQLELESARAQYGGHVVVLELQRNAGQTAAMQAGIDAARGEVLVTLDGDLQNDPADIPGMIEELIDKDLDLLVGWRKDRKDKLLTRRIPSRIANYLISRITGVKLHDYGCSLKAYKARVIKNVRLYGEMHRFIPAWVAAVAPAHRISERIVKHNPRIIGHSKYGISRTFRVLIDLLSVWFFMNFKTRPGHFFGSIGLLLIIISSLIFVLLGYDKFILGHDIGSRPLLLVGVVFLIAALQFFTTGILAEFLSRIYFETGTKCSYILRHQEAPERAWKNIDSNSEKTGKRITPQRTRSTRSTRRI